jgi:hypothetical protein
MRNERVIHLTLGGRSERIRLNSPKPVNAKHLAMSCPLTNSIEKIEYPANLEHGAPNAAPEMINPSDGEFGSMRPESGTTTLGADTPQLPKKLDGFLILRLDDEAMLTGVPGSELDVELSELSVFERTLVEEGTRDMDGVA